ncbi:MAG: hypothetical protein MR498_05835 [Limosilactobacillus reuteri]|nr:hypothetical protein [Limosilactobacillus reuteri]
MGSNRPTYPLFDGYSINNVTGKKTEITVLKDPELPIFVPCLEDTNYETEYDNSTPVMNYCPMCGRSLLKKDNPRFAPAIDAMKEEVKDDEAD